MKMPDFNYQLKIKRLADDLKNYKYSDELNNINENGSCYNLSNYLRDKVYLYIINEEKNKIALWYIIGALKELAIKGVGIKNEYDSYKRQAAKIIRNVSGLDAKGKSKALKKKK